MKLNAEIKSISRLTSTLLSSLNRLGLYYLRDLIFYKPYKYLRFKVFPHPVDILDKEEIILKCKVIDVKLSRISRKPTNVDVTVEGIGLKLIFFNKIPPFILARLKIGNEIIIRGVAERSFNEIRINHPEFILNQNEIEEYQPVYYLTYGISNRRVHSLILGALDKMEVFTEWHSRSIIEKYKLPSFNDAINIIHNNKKKINSQNLIGNFEIAERRIAFDELFSNMLALKQFRTSLYAGKSFKIDNNIKEEILQKLEFSLTSSQQNVLKEIEQDQQSTKAMNRLLQGDVGSGKTVVAMISMVNAAINGAQSVLMAPTDLLATQHYEFFKKTIGDKYNVGILTGKTKVAERRVLLSGLENGEIDILIGTHALFQDKVKFSNLAYIVIDEQHKFGVNQRLKLVQKSMEGKAKKEHISPDILIMTATPIPRSLALANFGDMDVSKITEKPALRKEITTLCMPISKLDNIINAIRKTLDRGEQIYWICPLIDAEEEEYLTDSVTRFKTLDKVFKGEVGLIHGKMPSAQKEEAMERFRKGETKILVATTVIEVGIDVKKATLMVIEHAEQFGLAQLHQLRGRVGRGSAQSYCILAYGVRTSSIAKKRLSVMKSSNDGFFIAEQDLKLRGSGEVLGVRQSGEQNFIFANLARDEDLLFEAHKLAGVVNAADYKELLELFELGQGSSSVLI